jgi:hypothetical protein
MGSASTLLSIAISYAQQFPDWIGGHGTEP